MKNDCTSAAKLGAAHRFRTLVYRQGTVDAGGVLDGNLILVASGDMSMGGRVNPDGSYAITDLDHNEANDLGDAELTAPDPLERFRADWHRAFRARHRLLRCSNSA